MTYFADLVFRRLYSHPESDHCPLKLILEYFKFLGAHKGSVVPQCQPKDASLPHVVKKIPYTSAMEDLVYCLRSIDIDARGSSEHSMKRGGATEAAKNGATVHEIQVAGHWTNAKTTKNYIEAICLAKSFCKFFI